MGTQLNVCLVHSDLVVVPVKVPAMGKIELFETIQLCASCLY